MLLETKIFKVRQYTIIKELKCHNFNYKHYEFIIL